MTSIKNSLFSVMKYLLLTMTDVIMVCFADQKFAYVQVINLKGLCLNDSPKGNV